MKTKVQIAAFLILPFSIAAQLPQQLPKEIRVNSASAISIGVTGLPTECVMEVPPWIKPGGMRSYYATTFHSRIYPSTINLATPDLTELHFDNGGYSSFIVSSPLTWFLKYGPINTSDPAHWRRNYEGIFSSHSFNYPGRGPVIVAFAHGENKNEKVTQKTKTATSSSTESWLNQSTVNATPVVNGNDWSTYSGFEDGGIYHDCFEAYNGFVNMSWNDDVQSNSWGMGFYYDYGPIAWPSNGYLNTNGTKASYGLRHPSSIVADGYIYIYYLDTRHANSTTPEGQGRDQGIKVTRVALGNALNENLYETYYNGAWNPSLPAGYTRSNVLASLNKKGPQSTVVVGDGGVVRFSVAKIRNTNYYLGVEEYEDKDDGKKGKLALHFSTDLIHWSGRKVIQVASDWTHSRYHYPIFLDQTGWTNTEVDLHNFFIIGTGGVNETSGNGIYNELHRLKLSIDIVPVQLDGGALRLTDLESTFDNGILHITAPEKMGNKKISIYTIYGQLIKEEMINGDSERFDVNVNDVGAAGIYILSVETENNRYTQKIVIQ
jgi:hypothetical protein